MNFQDMRHILLFDLRPKEEFYKCHIRDSYCVETVLGDQGNLSFELI